MNLLLVEPHELVAPLRARVTGERVRHVREVLGLSSGACLRAGVVDGALGEARLLSLGLDHAELELTLDQPPPPPLPLTLLLALPRPKMLKRILQMVAGLGVSRLVLIHTYRVEKSYWASPCLQPAALREQLLLGLAQARATQLPEVAMYKRFRPFVEDELPALIGHAEAWIAHPGACAQPVTTAGRPCVLAVGPEGGFIPFEVELMQAQGMRCIDLGPRIQRVEWAVPSLIARLF